jgi:deazaflavin-dependent oxidoreductase (nitroreductase family)
MPSTSPKLPLLWRLVRRMNPRMLALAKKGKAPKFVLLLTTTGRKSGLARTTPLQFEEENGIYYIGAGRGKYTDWYRNLLKNSQVEVEVRGDRFTARAEPLTTPAQVADFLQLRLKRHPVMVGLMLRMQGLPLRYSRADLEKFSEKIAAVVLRRIKG